MKPKVLIQYNTTAHYRRRIFQLLSECDETYFEIIADNSADEVYLQTLTPDDLSGINHIQAKTWRVRIPGLSELSWQPSAIARLWESRPDVAITLGSPYSLTAWAIILIGRWLDIPVLLWTHGLLGNENGPKWWLRRAFYHLSAGCLLYGNYAKELLLEKGFESQNLFVVYNSLDYDKQIKTKNQLDDAATTDWRQNLGVLPGEGLVVFTGRLQPIKRLDLLLVAISILASRGRRIHVAIVGDGEDRSKLLAQAERDKIADLVHFLGAHYDEEFLGLVLTAGDLCVVPSGAGLSVIHSLVYGTPVLIHDKILEHGPEWEAVEEGRTGYFYKYNDCEDLAAKIENAIFPISQKGQLDEQCEAIIRERYNPHFQVKIFVDAVKWCLKSKMK